MNNVLSPTTDLNNPIKNILPPHKHRHTIKQSWKADTKMSRCICIVTQAPNIPLGSNSFFNANIHEMDVASMYFLCLTLFLSITSSSLPMWTFGSSITLLRGVPQLHGSHPACCEAGSPYFHLKHAALCTRRGNETAFSTHPLQPYSTSASRAAQSKWFHWQIPRGLARIWGCPSALPLHCEPVPRHQKGHACFANASPLRGL